jgi:protein-disulfide isomerase
MQGATFNNIVLSVLLLCALVTTGLVVRRELVSDSPTVQTIQSDPTFLKDWRETLQQGIRVGPAGAPVQIVEFADFQCPYCARFEKRLTEIRRRHGDKVAVTFVHSPLASHDQAERAARAVECAHA